MKAGVTRALKIWTARGSRVKDVGRLGLTGLIVLAALGLGPPTAGAVSVAYPDLQVLVPTGDLAIFQASSSSPKELEFTHITEDTGAGPLEIRPEYNPATGISQGYQALYSSPSPGVWKFDETVPIVGPMIWDPPSDYIFPLDKFWLYTVASGGGLGNLVATSPKVLFCMTSDTFVGGVPNTPSTNGYPDSGCSSPTGTLGLSVGWGDEYDQTDEGEDIDISSLPERRLLAARRGRPLPLLPGVRLLQQHHRHGAGNQRR